MIPTTQRKALTVLAELCELAPEGRLGQLLAHLDYLGVDQTGHSLWDIEDDQLLAVLNDYRTDLVRRSRMTAAAG